MSLEDLSTRRLKRVYLSHLKTAWHYHPLIDKERGLEKAEVMRRHREAVSTATAARGILEARGVLFA